MARTFRNAKVHDIIDLSPHMRRIILSGEELHDFPKNYETAHVKVMIPQQHLKRSKFWQGNAIKKNMRSYTVRSFNATQKELTIDFAVNDHKGAVADWALNAQKGDIVGIGGPGPIKYIDLHAPWHLFAGDLTALPAIVATLEKLPKDAIGFAFLQIPTSADKQVIKAPSGIELQWIENKDVRHNALLDAVSKLRWLEGTPHIFMAGESAHIKEINRLLKSKAGYDKNKVYASGYWKA